VQLPLKKFQVFFQVFTFTAPSKRGITVLTCRARDPHTVLSQHPHIGHPSLNADALGLVPKPKCQPMAHLRKQVQNKAAHGMAGGIILALVEPGHFIF
jgi:hypothetical protein